MAQSTSDQKRFLLDDRIVTQVRYALTLGRAVEQDAAAGQRSAIELADLRFYRGRKEVAAFAGLSAAEVDTLVGQENRLKMEQGIGRGKRNQAAHAIAGKLERHELIPVQTTSTGLDAKARPQAAVSTEVADRSAVAESAPVTPALPVRAADELGYQLKHYDELGPVVREQADLNSALEAFRRSDPLSMPAIVRDQAVLVDRDPDTGEVRFQDEAVGTAYGQHVQQDGPAKHQFPARGAPPAPAATSAMSPADRERLSALVTRMQAALDQTEARSFVETTNWVRQDAEALQAIAGERKHLATMVMTTAARRHPDYRAALSRQYPDIAIQVENNIHAAELDERLAQLRREPGTEKRGAAQPRQGRQPETERNSIERDDERVQQSSRAEAEGPRARPMQGVGQQVDLDNFKITKPPVAEVATSPPETGNKPTQRIPREIEDAYLRVGNKFHYTQKPTLQAFEDKGARLETRSNSARIASDLVKIAGARDWGSIRVKGSDEFRQKVWLEATLQGIAVKGYKPSEVDLAQLAQRDRLAVANSVERDAARLQPQMTRRPEADRSGKEPSQPAPDKAQLAGTLLEHGKANFNFDQAEPLNYYVKYRDAAGKERVSWGVGLEPAIKDSQAKVGQHIELKNLGKQPVSVTANLRDDDGKVVGKQTLAAHRNQWQIKADSFRSEEPKQAIKAHPELVGAYAILRAAQVVADQNFQSREDRERFMTLAKETLARQMAERQDVPAVRIREQTSESRLEHGKERTIGR